MARYLVIEVGCIECNGGGDSDPTLILATDDLEQAATVTPEGGGDYRSDGDSFVVDTLTGQILTFPLMQTDKAL